MVPFADLAGDRPAESGCRASPRAGDRRAGARRVPGNRTRRCERDDRGAVGARRRRRGRRARRRPHRHRRGLLCASGAVSPAGPRPGLRDVPRGPAPGRRAVGDVQSTRLYLLTRNAQPSAIGDRANPAHAVLWGLGRTLALEHPRIWGRIIDIDDALPAELAARHVAAETHADDTEDQIVYRAGQRRAPRLQQLATPPGAPAELGRHTSQLVIGATGNIGPSLIRQLAAMGAATIVAVSRRAGSQLADLAAELAPAGTTLVEVAADAADEVAMGNVFARFGSDLPPLEGVYVAALAGRPVVLEDMTADDVAAMFIPKVDAVAVLHRLTMATPVRHFVLFSSITGLIGSRWLSHYTATGAYLDSFAYARRTLGLAATVVDWGLWKSFADTQPVTTDAGLRPMPDDVAIATLPMLMGPDAGVHSAVVDADWPLLAEAYRMRATLRVVDQLVGTEPAGDIDLPDPQDGTLLGSPTETDSTAPASRTWLAGLRPGSTPYPGGHRVRGTEVVPVSVLTQTLLECGRRRGPNQPARHPFRVSDRRGPVPSGQSRARRRRRQSVVEPQHRLAPALGPPCRCPDRRSPRRRRRRAGRSRRRACCRQCRRHRRLPARPWYRGPALRLVGAPA